MPLKMYFSAKIYHNELDKNDYSKHVNVLCADVVSAEVDVFKLGRVDMYGSEFLYHYFYNGNKEAAIMNPTIENPEWNKYYLMCSLSDSNGWGRANCKCFTPLSSYTTDDSLFGE